VGIINGALPHSPPSTRHGWENPILSTGPDVQMVDFPLPCGANYQIFRDLLQTTTVPTNVA
jgi:hypothetical protein